MVFHPQHMMAGVAKAASSPNTPKHLLPHLQKRLKEATKMAKFPMPMRPAKAKTTKRNGQVTNPVWDMDNIDSGMEPGADVANNQLTNEDNSMASTTARFNGQQPSRSSTVGGGLRNPKKPIKNVYSAGSSAPKKVTGVGPSGEQPPRKTVVGLGSEQAPRKVIASGMSSEKKPLSSKASVGKSVVSRGKKTPKRNPLFGRF